MVMMMLGDLSGDVRTEDPADNWVLLEEVAFSSVRRPILAGLLRQFVGSNPAGYLCQSMVVPMGLGRCDLNCEQRYESSRSAYDSP